MDMGKITLDSIIENQEDNVRVIKLNRPHRKNALDANMYRRVTQILDETAKDNNVLMVVITGVGDYYSSGNDLLASIEQQSAGTNVLSVLHDFIRAFITFPKLLIAIVNGPAIGIAATTLSLFDLVFAAENSYFYTPFTKLGILAEGCSTFTFPRLIGDRKAAEMLLFNHKMSAKEALKCGLVNMLYNQQELQEKVWQKIKELAKLPPHSVLLTKKLMRNPFQEELLKTNDLEIQELEKIWRSQVFIDNLIKFSNRKSKI